MQNKITETMEKTIHEWFLEAKENGANLADAAIENAMKLSSKDVLNRECLNLKKAIIMAFVWDDSPEGGDYWGNVCWYA